MGFQEALRTCFAKYARADGRASRSEFWYFHLAIFVYMFVAGFGLGIVGASDAQMDLAILFLLIPVIVPSICVTARRLHDLNYSCLLYTSPSPRDRSLSRMPSSA